MNAPLLLVVYSGFTVPCLVSFRCAAYALSDAITEYMSAPSWSMYGCTCCKRPSTVRSMGAQPCTRNKSHSGSSCPQGRM